MADTHNNPEWLAARATWRELESGPWTIAAHMAEGPADPLTDAILRTLDQIVPDYGAAWVRQHALVRLGFVTVARTGEMLTYTRATECPPCPEPVPFEVAEQARIDREVAAERKRRDAEADARLAAAKFLNGPEDARALRALNEALAASRVLERVAALEETVSRLEAALAATADH